MFSVYTNKVQGILGPRPSAIYISSRREIKNKHQIQNCMLRYVFQRYSVCHERMWWFWGRPSGRVVWKGQLEVLTYELRTGEREQTSSEKNLTNNRMKSGNHPALVNFMCHLAGPQGAQIFG